MTDWIVRSSPEGPVGRGVLRVDQGPRPSLERQVGRHQGRADDSLNARLEGGGNLGQPVRRCFRNVTTCYNDNNGVHELMLMLMLMLMVTVAIMAAG